MDIHPLALAAIFADDFIQLNHPLFGGTQLTLMFFCLSVREAVSFCTTSQVSCVTIGSWVFSMTIHSSLRSRDTLLLVNPFTFGFPEHQLARYISLFKITRMEVACQSKGFRQYSLL